MPSDKPPLRGADYPFRSLDLAFLPASIRAWAHDLTYNEVHSAGMGLVGFPLALLFAAGYTEPVAGVVLAVVAIAFGLRRAPNDLPVAGRVVRREPWYFVLILVVSFAAGLAAATLV